MNIQRTLVALLVPLALITAAFILSACGPTYVPIEHKLKKAKLPKECESTVNDWIEPDDVTSVADDKAKIGKAWVTNRRNFRSLRYFHSICRKHAAQQSAPSSGKTKSVSPKSWWQGT